MSDSNYNNALAPTTELLWYRIEGVLGQGAFGITYLAHDIYLDRKVAIKEYMPGAFSMRMDDLKIEPISSDLNNDYKSGLERFLSEARTLTKFKHPNLVQVFNIFEENNTAYMVMSYEQGRSLKQVLKTRKSLTEKELMQLIVPLMDGLEMMHDKGFIHRDIKPGNIFIRDDNSPVLLDFGSARQTHYFFSDDIEESQVKTLTNFVSPGYTPIEQYSGKSDRQGPWTDIYALGATLYKCITGRMPIEAVERSESIVHVSKDEYVSLFQVTQGQYSKLFLKAIDHSLEFKAQNRPQTIKEWRNEFGISMEEFDTIELPEDNTDELSTPVDIQHEITETLEATTYQHTETEVSDATTIVAQNNINKNHTLIKSLIFYGAAASLLLSLFIITYYEIANDKTDIAQEIIDSEIEQTKDTENKENNSDNISIVANATPDEILIQTTPIEKIENFQKPDLSEPIISKQEQDKKEEITLLLRLAAKDIQAKRYTVPKNNNAFDKYQKVLTIDSTNKDAKNGILLLTDKFMIAAYKAIEENDFDGAQANIKKADTLSPNLDAVRRAEEHLERKKRQFVAAHRAAEQEAELLVNNTPTEEPTVTRAAVDDNVTVVDLSRDVPNEQKDSIPDNEIDRTIQSIQTLFE